MDESDHCSRTTLRRGGHQLDVAISTTSPMACRPPSQTTNNGRSPTTGSCFQSPTTLVRRSAPEWHWSRWLRTGASPPRAPRLRWLRTGASPPPRAPQLRATPPLHEPRRGREAALEADGGTVLQIRSQYRRHSSMRPRRASSEFGFDTARWARPVANEQPAHAVVQMVPSSSRV